MMKVRASISLLLLAASSVQAHELSLRRASEMRDHAAEEARERKLGSKKKNPSTTATPDNRADTGVDGTVVIGSTVSGGNPNLLEKHQCIDYYTDDRIAQALLVAVRQGLTSDCTTEQAYLSCGNTVNQPGCCRYHSSKLTCDLDNDFLIQPCICNTQTKPREQRIDDITSDPIVFGPTPSPYTGTPPPTVPFDDSCQIWNPASEYYVNEGHPYQSLFDAEEYFVPCYSGADCSGATNCCTVNRCYCEAESDVPGNGVYCLP